MKTKTSFRSTLLPIFSLIAFASPAQSAVILSSDFTGVSKTGNTADSFTWDTVNGIDTPATSLDFFDGDSTSTVSFHDVSANEIDVNNNMTAGGWRTSFDFQLDSSTSTIELTQLVLGLRLTSGSGADNTTGNKSGQMIAEIVGSTSGSIGIADLGGNQGYPSVEYTRTLDLTGFSDLNDSETYTLTLTAEGTGFGHHKSLQNFSLEAIPEPSIAVLGTLGLISLLRRRR